MKRVENRLLKQLSNRVDLQSGKRKS
jgi:hypothetical protein